MSNAPDSGDPKPCPFCGATGTDESLDNPGFHVMGHMDHWWPCCLTCYTYHGKGFHTPEEAIEAWNRRAETKT